MEIKPKKIVIVEPLVQQEDPPETVIPQVLQLNIEEILLEEDPIPELVELNNSIKNCIKPESECVVDITNNWSELEVSEDVKKLLNDLFIRFNTSPKLYNKIDYLKLLQLIYGSLIHLYKNNPEDLIVTNWLNPLNDTQVPSEKLTKETIDSLDNEITQVNSDLQTEIGDRQSEITRVEGLISDEAAARQQADTNLQNTKLDNLTAGSNISITNNVISAVDTIYDDTEVKSDISDLQLNKLDNLTAGANVSITNNVISAVDTIYDDTEVRGLIDQVDSKVDDLDDFECGTIVPTTTNFVEGTEYTIHEALQRTANLFEGYQGYIDDINELIPNQATSLNQLADKDFVNSTIATNAANFRGNWSTWTSVPTNVNDYPADYSGSKIPTNNDYLVVLDGTGYGSSYTGMWRFIYVGDWATDGKNGWNPQYRVGSAFTQAQQDAIDSGITSTKVSTYDGYATSIGALQTDKVDKIYTASKVYGTDPQGSQIGYTAGDGISFTNGQIVNTRTSAAWGNITGTLSNQTDLSNVLNSKEDKSNKVISISSSSTDTLYPSAKCVYDEFTTTVTSEQASSVGDVTVYTNLNIQVIDKTQDSSSTFAIDPNKMYMFGTRASLTITLNTPGDNTIVNEYMFLFTSGSTATSLSVPNTVVWLKDPDVQTGKKYAVSIENNLGVIGEWSNE